MVAESDDQYPGDLRGRKLYIPQMSRAGARLVAASLRALGYDAAPTPESDAETLLLGGQYSSGEECLPHRVTLGDFLKITRQPGFDPKRTAFFMPTAEGPCRFGQYSVYLRKVLAQLGLGDVLVISPSSRNGYDGMRLAGADAQLSMWMALVLSDTVTRLLLKTRPYEKVRGAADAAGEASLAECEAALERPGLSSSKRRDLLVGCVESMRDRFRAVPADYVEGKPLIGLVGEIYCRQNDFSNDQLARRIESLGGECWLSDIAEWIWYTNWNQARLERQTCGFLSLAPLKATLKTITQRRYEHRLLAPLHDDFVGYEEPLDVREILERSRPYLPAEGCLGEMVLSVGKASYLAEKGAAGIIDISPFTCMNGVICEAVYPALSSAHADIPIRVCYFDGVNTTLDRDLEIFLDLARAFLQRSPWRRRYPAFFRRRAARAEAAA